MHSEHIEVTTMSKYLKMCMQFFLHCFQRSDRQYGEGFEKSNNYMFHNSTSVALVLNFINVLNYDRGWQFFVSMKIHCEN